MYSGGVNFLLPDAYNPAWTRLDDGVFNAYPPSYQTPTGLLGTETQLESDTTFGQVIPIPLTINTQTALVGANTRRGFILIQNNSTATTPDTPPNLYVTLDGPVPLPLVLNLAILPGSGLVLDRRVYSNAIYVRWGPFVNGGLTAVVGGVMHQGLLPVR